MGLNAVNATSWRQQAGLPETPISLYQQRFGDMPRGTIKLAVDFGRGNELEQECKEALRTGQPIKDFSRYIPEYARSSAPQSLAAETKPEQRGRLYEELTPEEKAAVDEIKRK